MLFLGPKKINVSISNLVAGVLNEDLGHVETVAVLAVCKPPEKDKDERKGENPQRTFQQFHLAIFLFEFFDFRWS